MIWQCNLQCGATIGLWMKSRTIKQIVFCILCLVFVYCICILYLYLYFVFVFCFCILYLYFVFCILYIVVVLSISIYSVVELWMISSAIKIVSASTSAKSATSAALAFLVTPWIESEKECNQTFCRVCHVCCTSVWSLKLHDQAMAEVMSSSFLNVNESSHSASSPSRMRFMTPCII